MAKTKGLLTDEEKTDIIDDLDDDLEVYRENLADYEKNNKNKRDSVMSKFNQKDCDEQIAFYKHKIEMTVALKDKIRNL